MQKQIKNILRLVLFFGIGIGLFYLVYRDVDFNEVFVELKNINYWWFLLFFVLVILSNVSRTIRWQMLIKSYGGKAGFINTFLAVIIGYFANMALPRLGEVSRCAVISKYEKQALSKVLGTMVSERIFDVLMIILLTIIVIIFQNQVFLDFLEGNPEIQANTLKLFKWEIIGAAILLFALSIIFIYHIVKGRFDKYIVFKKLSDFLQNFWKGLFSIRKVKNIPLFIFHSIFIWFMYFLMIYVVFPAFEGFSDLGLMVALTVFVAASYGMIAPTPGGIGAYHFMLSQTLILYGIPLEKALIFALVVHGMQTLAIIISGILALILLPVYNQHKNKQL